MRLLFAFALLLVSCVTIQTQLRDQAEFELSCPRRLIETWQINKRSWAVVACGKHVVYHHIRGVWIRSDVLTATDQSLR